MKLIMAIMIFCCMGLTACSGAGSSGSNSEGSVNLFGEMNLGCGSESCLE